MPLPIIPATMTSSSDNLLQENALFLAKRNTSDSSNKKEEPEGGTKAEGIQPK